MKLKRNLFVTSPLMEGDDVKHVQRVLNSTGPGTRFGNFRPGKVDGVYGAETAKATARAKFWLGYETKDVSEVYGQALEDYLTGTKDLPPAYKKRRAARLKKTQDTPLRVKAFARVKTEIGIKEHPADSNIVKYSRWYGLTGPWCAMFVTWAYALSGSKTFMKGQRWASVGFFLTDARDRDWGLRVIGKDEVKQGDLVTFDWDGGGMGKSPWLSDHIGLFDRWTNKSRGEFRTIEGNTSVSNNSNGGQVMARNRTLNQVSAFVRCET